MDNYNGESLATLMHKLTKYQTLLAGTQDSKKSETYKYKIGQYTSKLAKLGVNSSSLNQMGGFNPSELLAAKKHDINTLLSTKSTHDLRTLSENLAQLQEETTKAVASKNQMLKKFTDFTGEALGSLDELKRKINDMAPVDTSSQLATISGVGKQLKGLIDTDLGTTIEKVLTGSLLDDTKKIAEANQAEKPTKIQNVANALKAWGDVKSIVQKALETHFNPEEAKVFRSITKRIVAKDYYNTLRLEGEVY